MTIRVIRGSKQEIAQMIASLEGDVREAIVFVDEPRTAPLPLPTPATDQSVEGMFAEMEPYTTKANDFDDSRAAIYQRMEGE